MAKDEPKPALTPKPEPVFSHPGKRVFVLVPADSKEQALVLKHLESELFPYLETLPTVTSDLRLAKFRGGEVVYGAHPIDARVQGVDGRFSNGTAVHVSAPVFTEQYLAVDGDGFSTLSHDAVIGALGGMTKPSRSGRCYQLKRVSDELIFQIADY